MPRRLAPDESPGPLPHFTPEAEREVHVPGGQPLRGQLSRALPTAGCERSVHYIS